MAWKSGWNIRRKIGVNNTSGGTKTNADILVTLDTSSLIASGQMRSDGFDIYFTDAAATTNYNFWIESCFNTDSTSIWFRVASLPAGISYYYLYYGSPSASQPATWQTYTGNAIFMYSGSVPSGYGNFSLLNGKYPRCAAWYSGSYTTSGSSIHTHTATTTSGSAGRNCVATGNSTLVTSTHTITLLGDAPCPTISLVFITGSGAQITNSSSKLLISTILFYSGSSDPANHIQYAPLVNVIPSGSSATCVLKSTSHNHSSGSSLDLSVAAGGASVGAAGDTAANTHTHTMVVNVGNAYMSHPNYITMYPMITNTTTGISLNSILMFTALPTYGWRQLSEANLRFPLGSGSFGTTGGGETHTHVLAGTSGVPSVTTNANSTGNTAATNIHTHNSPSTSDAASSDPAYIDVIYAVKSIDGLVITLGSEEGATVTIPTKGYTPYVPTYASAFMFVETPRWASDKPTAWELRLNSGNRLSSYTVTLADPHNEWRGRIKGFDPIRCWTADGPRFDMLMYGIVEDFTRLKQDTSTFTISGRNLGAIEAYKNWPYNYYNRNVQDIILYGATPPPLSGSSNGEFIYDIKIGNPNKTLTIRGEKRKVTDIWTDIATRCSSGGSNWIHFCCSGEHQDERRIPNKHFELQQDIPSEVYLTTTDVLGYEQLETIRPCIQKLQIEYAQGIITGSVYYRQSGSLWTDLTAEAGSDKGTQFTLIGTPSDTLYIGNVDRFWKLYYDLSGSGLYTGSGGTGSLGWQYSQWGTGSTTNTGSWDIMDVSDTTYGYVLDGDIEFNVPVEWNTGSFRTGSAITYNYGITATGSASGSNTGLMWATQLTSITSTNPINTISFYAHKTGSARLGIYNNGLGGATGTSGGVVLGQVVGANNQCAVPITLTSGMVQIIGMQVAGTEAANIYVGLYTSGSGISGSYPQYLLTQSASTALSTTSGSLQYVPVTPIYVQSGDYWVGFNVSANKTMNDSTTGYRRYFGRGYAALTDTWNTGSNTIDAINNYAIVSKVNVPLTKLWESAPTTITTGSSTTGSINTVNISSGTPTSLSLNSGSYWLAWQAGDTNIQGSYTYQTNSGSMAAQAYGNFPSTWPITATGSNSGSTLYITNNVLDSYAPWYYWVRQTGSIVGTAATCYQILMANLSPSVTLVTGSGNQWGTIGAQYEYVYRGDLTDSGSAITYGQTVLNQLHDPIKVLRVVMRGSTYWRPWYTLYWGGADYSGSGRYRISNVTHRRSLEGYATILETSAIVT